MNAFIRNISTRIGGFSGWNGDPDTDSIEGMFAAARHHVQQAAIDNEDIAGVCAQLVRAAVEEAPFAGADPECMAAAATRGAVQGAVEGATSLDEAVRLAVDAVRGVLRGTVDAAVGGALSMRDLVSVGAIRGAEVGARQGGHDVDPVQKAVLGAFQA